MSRYRIRVDLIAAFAPPHACPGCGAPGLRGVSDGERVRFHCASCQHTWSVELGHLYPSEAETEDAAGAGAGTGQESGPC